MALMPVRCVEERFGAWELGHAFLPDLADEAAGAFLGRVQAAVVDRPHAASGLFRWKAGADDWMTNRNSLSLPVHHSRTDGLEEYLPGLEKDLAAVRDLLGEAGSAYVFADQRTSADVRMLLNDVFGRSNFMNEIIWAQPAGRNPAGRFTRSHQTIFLYRRGGKALFDADAAGRVRGRLKSHMKRSEEGGRAYYARESRGREYRYFEDDVVSVGDVWADIPDVAARDEERTGWEGQRPEALLNRMIAASSAPGGIVCGVPSGSGTVAAASERLGRRALLFGRFPAERMLARRRLLLAGSEGFSFRDGGDPPDAQPEVAASFAGGTIQLEVYHLSASHPSKPESLMDDGLGALEYWAAGRYADGVFTACAWSMRTRQKPTLLKALPVGGGAGRPCMHLVDATGEQWFYLME